MDQHTQINKHKTPQNRVKNKNHMIISVDAAKSFDRIQYDKSSHETRNKRMYLNIIKAIYDKLIANIIQKRGKTETISTKVRNEKRVFTLSTLIQHSFVIPSHTIKRERRNKRNSNREGRSQVIPNSR
jgi:hypothetical protein